jgi:uncharacterized protein YigA (DUF484 family)
MGKTATENDLTYDAGKAQAREIESYLRRHPGFLTDHPELVEVLNPPPGRAGRDVVDMQLFMIQRLQKTVNELRSDQGDLLAATRLNRSNVARIHAAVLALYGPGAMNDLVELIKTDLPNILEVDVVAICVEAADHHTGPLPASGGVAVVEPGTVEGLLGLGREVALLDGPDRNRVMFGGAATLVKSCALVRLQVAGPSRPALLALGSRDEARFEPGQSTELLAFLGQALGRRLREWLDTTT